MMDRRAWLTLGLSLVPIGLAIGAGIMHVGALEQRITDQAERIEELFMLVIQLVNGLLSGEWR